MRVFLPTLACLLVARFTPRAGAALQDALLARQVLADAFQTCVVRVEFAPQPPRPPIYAMVFSLENILWMYAPEFGTRALGPATATWPDATVLSSRLRGIDAGVDRVTVYANPTRPAHRLEQHPLGNACVIASLGALTRTLATEKRPDQAGLILLSYDVTGASLAALQVNHCLLAWRTRGRWHCLDPNHVHTTFPLENVTVGEHLDPALMALALQQHYPLKSVLFLPLSPATLNRVTTSLQWQALPLAN